MKNIKNKNFVSLYEHNAYIHLKLYVILMVDLLYIILQMDYQMNLRLLFSGL